MPNGDQHVGYYYVRKPKHPLARPDGRVGMHRLVLYESLGPGEHPCHWCQKLLVWGEGTVKGILTVDHLDGNHRNNDLSNLVAACHRCNVTRHNLSTWEQRICEKCTGMFITKRYRKVRFCSLSCARKADWDRRTTTHCPAGHVKIPSNGRLNNRGSWVCRPCRRLYMQEYRRRLG